MFLFYLAVYLLNWILQKIELGAWKTCQYNLTIVTKFYGINQDVNN